MADQAYQIAHEKKKDRLIVQIQNTKRVRVVIAKFQRFHMISENPCQLAKSVTHLWIVEETVTEIQVGRRSLQEFLKRPSNQPFKSRRVPVESTMMTLRLSRRIEVEREASSAGKVNSIQCLMLSRSNKSHICHTLLTLVICQLEKQTESQMMRFSPFHRHLEKLLQTK